MATGKLGALHMGLTALSIRSRNICIKAATSIYHHGMGFWTLYSAVSTLIYMGSFPWSVICSPFFQCPFLAPSLRHKIIA